MQDYLKSQTATLDRERLDAARSRLRESANAEVYFWLRSDAEPVSRPGEAARARTAAVDAVEVVRQACAACNARSPYPGAPIVLISGLGEDVDRLVDTLAVDQIGFEEDRLAAEHLSLYWDSSLHAPAARANGYDGSGPPASRVLIWETCVAGATWRATVTGGVVMPGSWCNDTHPERVAATVRDGFNSRGAALGASLYHAGNPANFLAEHWGLSNNTLAMNHSLETEMEWDQSGLIEPWTRYRDWLAVGGYVEANQNGIPTMTYGAGNGGSNAPNLQFVSSRAYNGVITGSHNASNTISWFSSWRNPTSPFGDRELPEIVAPGEGLTLGNAPGLNQGTSVAAPMVAGAVAAMLDASDGALSWYPEARKAIILASNRCSVDGGHLQLGVGIDHKDGAGRLSVNRTAVLARTVNNRNGNTTATSAGYVHGSLNLNSTTAFPYYGYGWYVWSTKHRLKRTAGAPINSSIRVALTWNATPTCTYQNSSSCGSYGPDAELNLMLVDTTNGNVIAMSASWDNNYEFIQLPGSDLVIDREYEIWVVLTKDMIPPRRNSTWFGLAWQAAQNCQ